MKGLFLFLFLWIVFIEACSKKTTEVKVSPGSKYYSCLKNAPKWVIDEKVKNMKLSAVGSAKIGDAGFQFAVDEAKAIARDEIARTTSVVVKNLIKNFSQATGVKNSETVDKVSEQVSKQVSYSVLRGSKVIKKWVSPCDEVFVLVAVDPKLAKSSIKEAIITSFKNEEAMWQKFQSEEAFEELEREIEKEFKSYKEN